MNKVSLTNKITEQYNRQNIADGFTQIQTSINAAADGYLFPVKRLAVANSPYSVNNNESVFLVDASGGAVVLNLRPAMEWETKRISVKKIDASANTVTIDANGVETIDGSATKVISTQYASLELVSQGGAVWVI